MPRRKVAGAPPEVEEAPAEVLDSEIQNAEPPLNVEALRLEKLLYLHIAAMESARTHLRKMEGGCHAHALADLERHLPEWKGKPREPCG